MFLMEAGEVWRTGNENGPTFYSLYGSKPHNIDLKIIETLLAIPEMFEYMLKVVNTYNQIYPVLLLL